MIILNPGNVKCVTCCLQCTLVAAKGSKLRGMSKLTILEHKKRARTKDDDFGHKTSIWKKQNLTD